MWSVEQLYGKSLLEFSCGSANSVEAVRVVSECAVEIRSGLMSDCSIVQSCHWDLKLASLCMCRTLASHAAHTDSDIFHMIPSSDLIHSLPHWNFDFYFQIVVQNKWTKYLVEVIMFPVIKKFIPVFIIHT